MNERMQGYSEATLLTEQAEVLVHCICIHQCAIYLKEVMFLMRIKKNNEKY